MPQTRRSAGNQAGSGKHVRCELGNCKVAFHIISQCFAIALSLISQTNAQDCNMFDWISILLHYSKLSQLFILLFRELSELQYEFTLFWGHTVILCFFASLLWCPESLDPHLLRVRNGDRKIAVLDAPNLGGNFKRKNGGMYTELWSRHARHFS